MSIADPAAAIYAACFVKAALDAGCVVSVTTRSAFAQADAPAGIGIEVLERVSACSVASEILAVLGLGALDDDDELECHRAGVFIGSIELRYLPEGGFESDATVVAVDDGGVCFECILEVADDLEAAFSRSEE